MFNLSYVYWLGYLLLYEDDRLTASDQILEGLAEYELLYMTTSVSLRETLDIFDYLLPRYLYLFS